MLEAALAETLFGCGRHDSRCWYHAAPAATSNSVTKSRPTRSVPDRRLVPSFCLSFEPRLTDANASPKSSAGFGKRSSSENEVPSRSIGSAGASRVTADADEFPAPVCVCNNFSCMRSASTSCFNAVTSSALGARTGALGRSAMASSSCTNSAASLCCAFAGASSGISGNSMPQNPCEGSLNSTST